MTNTGPRRREIRSTTLSNGLHTITESMPHVRSVAVGVWIGTGARREKPEQSGISHFIEHMVFQGTENYSSEEIARAVDSIGGNLDAYTAKELVSFNTKVLDEHLPIVFDVLADLVIRPLFHPESLNRERSIILEELKMERDSPEYLVHEIFSRQFWKDHALGMPILGTRENIEAFTESSVRAYFNEVYTASNIVITAAGNLSHEALVDLVTSEFGALPATPPPAPPVKPSPQAHVHLENKTSLEQIHLCLGIPAYPIGHQMRYAGYLLNTILGGGMSSRLFQNIREKRGLAYSVFSELNLYRDAGCLLVGAGTSRETLAELVKLTLEELHEIKDRPVAPGELQRAKAQLKGSLLLSLESTSSRMANLARQYLFFGRFFELDELIASIEAVTAGDLLAVTQDLFDSDRLGLTALGDLDGLRLPELKF